MEWLNPKSHNKFGFLNSGLSDSVDYAIFHSDLWSTAHCWILLQVRKISCVTLSKLLNFFVPHVLHM